MEQEADGADHSLAAPSLSQQLTEELALMRASMTVQIGGASPPPLIISKVGEPTRGVDPAEYDPQYVSVGPYHRTSNRSLARDVDKLRSLDAVLMSPETATRVDIYVNQLELLESSARSCYANTFPGMTSRDFVRMLLLDGCYILARFGNVTAGATGHGPPPSPRAAIANATSPEPNGHTDGEHNGVVPLPIDSNGCSNKLVDVAVARDVFYLFENQIPFFVIKKIHEVMKGGNHISAAEKIAEYVQRLLQNLGYSIAKPALESPVPAGNLLHMLHMHFRPTDRDNHQPLVLGDSTSTGEKVGRWRTATEYYAAGVKFKKRELRVNEARCILDVKLDGGTLEVPYLNIDSETLCMLRNLMALEQHNLEALGSHVTAYCVFLSQVACTAKDVALLSKKGILVHQMGSNDEVAKHLGDLCKGAVFSSNDASFNYLRSTCQALEQHFHSRLWNRMASLRHDYFSNPWVALAVLAAVVQLTCAVLQAAYAVLSYRNTPNPPS